MDEANTGAKITSSEVTENDGLQKQDGTGLVTDLQDATLDSRDKLEMLDKERIKAKLYTPEQEEEHRNDLVDTNRLLYTAKAGDKVITIYGDRHPRETSAVQDIAAAFVANRPDVLYVEGDYHKIIANELSVDPNLTGEAVLEKHGEQGYMAWLGLKNGVDVKSWDIPFIKQLQFAVKNHGRDATMGWMVGQALEHIHKAQASLPEDQRGATPRHVLEAAAGAAGLSVEEFKMQIDAADLDDAAIDVIARKYTKQQLGVEKGVAEMTTQEAKALSDPAKPGETNAVIHSFNVLRDAHAMDVFYDAKKQYNKIFATSGRSHAVTWQPAVSALFKDSTHVFKDNQWQPVAA